MKRVAYIPLALLAALMTVPHDIYAQWTKVFQLPGTRGASAYFFNANEGLIGTGEFNPIRPTKLALIFYTTNGGATWNPSKLPRNTIRGEVTDIHFLDPTNGWATIRETRYNGWSGVYHSTDRGRSWSFVRAAEYPTGIRVTRRGVFYCNHTDPGAGPLENGVIFSSDTGKTWTNVGASLYPLGIDFVDDANGFATGGGGGGQGHLITTDGGKTWTMIDVPYECWSTFGDPTSKNFIVANEIPHLGGTNVLRAPIGGSTETAVKSFNDTLTGGISGWRGCTTTIYVQGRSYMHDGPRGIIRSANGGINWKDIGGPTNVEDTRFAVTGRGAVVYAFDSSGGVWKTGAGGDTTLSPSALKYVTIQKTLPSVSARRCDSAYVTLLFGYRACDSSRVARVTFINDSLGELSVPQYSNDFRFYSLAHTDSLNILYQPSREGTWQAQVRLTLAQPDGYEEDTTITIDLTGLAPQVQHVTFLDTTSPQTIDFGNVSVCTGDVRPVVIANNGCAEVHIDQLGTSDPVFSLVSSFKPFTLSAGSKRTFLVRFAPGTPGNYHTVLNVHHSSIRLDTLSLYGTGIAPSLAIQITKPDTVSSSLCDTTGFAVQLRNVACKAFKIISMAVDTPFIAPAVAQQDSIHSGESTSLNFRFAPSQQAPTTRTLTLKVSYNGAQEYDTTVTIVGVGTSGLPQLLIDNRSDSVYTINMYDVSFCSDAFKTVLLASRGCGLTDITGAVFSNANFQLERSAPQHVPSGKGDSMIVRYHPTKQGADSTELTLSTSSGTKTLKFYINVTSDPGNLQLSATQGVSAMTCDSASFTISITNGTCDSVTIVAAKITGANPNDFILRSALPIGLGTRVQTNLTGSFQPQDSLTRTATAVLTIKRSDGTTFDTTVALTATGIAVPAIPVQLVHSATGQFAGYDYLLELEAFSSQGSGSLKVGSLDFTLAMNTDLLTPIEIVDLSQDFVFNSGTIRLTHDSAMIHCELANDIVLPPAKQLCQIVCNTYVTDTFKTLVALHNPIFTSVSGNSSCIKTVNVDHDSGYIFTLRYVCPDSTLKDFIKYKTILIGRIAPNPTSGEVTITLDVPSGYKNDATLEVYDALGQPLLTKSLIFDDAGKKNVTVDLSSKESGVCYIILKSASGISTSRVMIEK